MNSQELEARRQAAIANYDAAAAVLRTEIQNCFPVGQRVTWQKQTNGHWQQGVVVRTCGTFGHTFDVWVKNSSTGKEYRVSAGHECSSIKRI